MFLTFDAMKVVRSSPLPTGRLYPQEYPGTPGHMVPSVATTKIPSDTTGAIQWVPGLFPQGKGVGT